MDTDACATLKQHFECSGKAVKLAIL